MKLTDKIEVLNADCMEVMAKYPDKYFDLAVVDPPYGLGDRLTNGGKKGSMGSMRNLGDGKVENWDTPPTKQYFDELMRVSRNQIIWGGNYFLDYLGKTDGFLVWDKMNGTNSMADAELAWKSFDGTTRMFRMHHFSKGYDEKIHPTQKPVKLYDWIFGNYVICKKCNNEMYYFVDGGDEFPPSQVNCDCIPVKILDTHGGSMSSVISADKAGLEMVCCELDKEYFDKAVDRFKKYKSQNVLEFK